MKLSIIVPIYNVERYILTCLESVFKQGLNDGDFEVILVNDGTKDGSLQQIAGLIATHRNITVIEQSNQGLSTARNTGLAHARGQYVLFLDSDDLLIDNTLPTLLSYALQYEADLILADYIKVEDKDIPSFIPPSQPPLMIEEKTGEEMFLKDLCPKSFYAWRTVYRRAFLEENSLRFIPGQYFEDILFTTACYLKANRCLKTSYLFYVYRQRENSIVSTINMVKLKHFNEIIAHLWAMRSDDHYPPSVRERIEDNVFAIFSIALWYATHNKAIFEKKADYVADLKQKVPDLHFRHGLKQHFVSWMFRHIPLTYLSLRYWLG